MITENMSQAGRNHGEAPRRRPVRRCPGIGYLVVRELARTHRVALVDAEADEVRRAVAACRPDAIGVACDIIRQDAVRPGDRADRGIDVVMSGAGIGAGGSSHLFDPDMLAAQLSINVTGNWRFIHACFRHFIARRGYVLGISSGGAIAPTVGLDGNCAGKPAIEMLPEVLRLQVPHLDVGWRSGPGSPRRPRRGSPRRPPGR